MAQSTMAKKTHILGLKKKIFTNPLLSTFSLHKLPWLPPPTAQQVESLLKQQTHYRPALEIFNAALQHKGYRHNQSTYALIIRILGNAHKFKAMELVLQRLKKEPFTCHVGLFADVVKFYGRAGKPEAAISTFYGVHSFNCHYTQTLLNTLLRVLINAHSSHMARNILYDPKLKDVGISPNAWSYNLVIKAYCRVHDVDSAFGLFDYMQAEGCLPDIITYGTLVWGLCLNGRTQESLGLLDQMYENGYNPDVVIYNTIINGLCRQGELARANKMLCDMELRGGCKPDIVTYNTLINGLCKMGKLEEAFEVLKDLMPRKGIHPDVISFSTLMNFAKSEDCKVLQSNMLAKGLILDVAGCHSARKT